MPSPTGFLVWDCDGTLAYREGGWSGALAEAVRSKMPDSPVTSEQLRPYLQSGFPWHAPECAHPGLSAAEWWMDVEVIFIHALHSVGVASKPAREIAKSVRPIYLDLKFWKCYSDSISSLKSLTQLGWYHILLTNHVPELNRILDSLQLTPHFQVIFNSAETGWEKPNQHAFHLAQDWIDAHQTKGEMEKTWVIGDSLSADIKGAEEAGMKPILVRKREPGVTSYESLAELVRFLREKG